MNGGSVSFEYEWEPDGEDVEAIILDVNATITDYDPGVLSGPPENCYPPEGGEVEDLEVFFQDQTKMDLIPDALRSKLEEYAQEMHNDHGGY